VLCWNSYSGAKRKDWLWSAKEKERVETSNLEEKRMKRRRIILSFARGLYWIQNLERKSKREWNKRRRMLLYTLLQAFLPAVSGLRCYTDVEATKGLSVECGMSTGCLKIYKKAATFNHNGEFIPTHRRGPDIDLFRGCFLVATADTCYDSSSTHLSYCWCSHTDLCNGAPATFSPLLPILLPCSLLILSKILPFLPSSWSSLELHATCCW